MSYDKRSLTNPAGLGFADLSGSSGCKETDVGNSLS